MHGMCVCASLEPKREGDRFQTSICVIQGVGEGGRGQFPLHILRRGIDCT